LFSLEKWLRKLTIEAEAMSDDPKTAWKAAKEIASGLYHHHKKAISMKMRKRDGSLAKTDLENLEVWTPHFTKLYNRIEETRYDPTLLEELTPIAQDHTIGEAPTIDEVQQAFKKMQYEKSPGLNGIPTEAFKNLQGDGLLALYNEIIKVWDDPSYIPKEWTAIKMTILPKKGDLHNPNKWRGIALGDIAAKCIASIITLRLTHHISRHGIEEQCGCLFHKGCTDATFSMKSALQTLKEHGHSTYVLFVDLVKAFDTANRALLWKILEIYGVPTNTIRVIEKLHTNVSYQLNIGDHKTMIPSTVGVKQGDNLGPILFIILMNAVAETLNKKWDFATPDFRRHSNRGKPALGKAQNPKTKGTKFTVTSSYYVDDSAYIFLNRLDLERASKLIVSHYQRFGLTVHRGDNRDAKPESKTEMMFIPGYGQSATPADTAIIELDEHQFFGVCNQFKYLGTTFDSSLDDSIDVKARINKAKGAFATMARFLKDENISRSLRTRLYEATVVNIMLFGCESWALKIDDRQRLEAAHHTFLRSMRNISMLEVKEQRIKNDDIRQQMENCYSIAQIMELRRARWLEKIANMDETRNPRKLLQAWTPQARLRGRPYQTIGRGYRHTVEHYLKTEPEFSNWLPIARDHPHYWRDWVEGKLKLKKGTYRPLKKRRN
jgi:hypothetical protein